MKTLLESLLDDEDIIINKYDRKTEIEKWLKENCMFDENNCVITGNQVYIKGSILFKPTVERIPTELFVFKEIKDTCSFNLKYNPTRETEHKIKSLKGLPKTCQRFFLEQCNNIEDLQDLPEVSDYIYIDNCSNLKSLKGISKNIEQIDIWNCSKLESTKYIKNYEKLEIRNCKNLKDLQDINKSNKHIIFIHINSPFLNIEQLKYIPKNAEEIIICSLKINDEERFNTEKCIFIANDIESKKKYGFTSDYLYLILNK